MSARLGPRNNGGDMTEKPLILIAAGGTGGHMFPAQALAETMLRRGWRVKLATDARGARFTGGFSHAVQVEKHESATFARGGFVHKALVPFRIMAGICGALIRQMSDRPAVVIGFGGYPTIPALAAAWALRLPRLVHEQNGVLGRVNKMFARHVNCVACGTWPTQFSEDVVHTYTGNPVRAGILARAAAPYIAPGDYPMSLLVMGGSQGARVLSDVVPQAVALLSAPLRSNLRIVHQAREEDRQEVIRAYDAADVRADVRPFFSDIPSRLSEAQVVISRAGASSVADISVIGRPSILIPFAAATGDHQSVNARGLVDAGAAVMIPEALLTPQDLAEQITAILTVPGAAEKMVGNALSKAIPDAAERLADVIEPLSKGQKK